MTGASFDGKLNAEALQVEGDLLMHDAHYTEKVVMLFAHIGTNLDLRGAIMVSLNLSGASIAGDMRLGEDKSPSAGQERTGNRAP